VNPSRPLDAYLVAEFRTPEALVAAARALREAGHRGLDTYTPYPVIAVEEALGLRRSPVPRYALAGGLLGAAGGYVMQWWTNAVDFPINVANRPPHSPPAFIPITFELGVLFSAFAIFFGLMALFRLPRLHHPVFEAESFRSASVDAFWVGLEIDPGRAGELETELRRMGATHVSVVEARR
jgi:hypothetical protein